jgi:hypothetical protein
VRKGYRCVLGKMGKEGVEGIVKKLGGAMDRYSGAALIPVKQEKWGEVLEILSKKGRFTVHYGSGLIPDYLFLRPRDMKDKEVPYRIKYLKEKIEKATTGQ